MNSGASRLREFLCSLALCRAVKESISERAAEARRGDDQKQENKRTKEKKERKTEMQRGS